MIVSPNQYCAALNSVSYLIARFHFRIFLNWITFFFFFPQRCDYSVLTPFLPPKHEYVISIQLSPLQVKLYKHYLDHFSRRGSGKGNGLFADFQALQRIWTHPRVLKMSADKEELKVYQLIFSFSIYKCKRERER